MFTSGADPGLVLVLEFVQRTFASGLLFGLLEHADEDRHAVAGEFNLLVKQSRAAGVPLILLGSFLRGFGGVDEAAENVLHELNAGLEVATILAFFLVLPSRAVLLVAARGRKADSARMSDGLGSAAVPAASGRGLDMTRAEARTRSNRRGRRRGLI